MPVLHGDFESDFDSGGTIVRKENAFEFARQDFAKACGEFFDVVVGETREEHVVDFLRLLGDSGHDGGMAMAVEIGPPGRNCVDDAATVGSVKISAVRLGDLERRRIERFLREWMPDVQGSTHGANKLRSKVRRNTCNSVARLILAINGTVPTTAISP